MFKEMFKINNWYSPYRAVKQSLVLGIFTTRPWSMPRWPDSSYPYHYSFINSTTLHLEDHTIGNCTTTHAWACLGRCVDYANQNGVDPGLADQDDRDNVQTLAEALVYVRTGTVRYRQEIVKDKPGTRTLAVARELGAYVCFGR